MPAIQLLYQSALDSLNGDLHVAIVNAHADPLLREIANKSDLTVTQHFKPEFDALARMGVNCPEALEDEFELIMVIPSKNKQQTLGWMADAMGHLNEGGKLLMACANSHGAKSYESALKKLAGNIASSSKSKCRIFSARRTNGFDRELETTWLEDAMPRIVDSHGMLSQPGLFSWDRADTGSELLLEHLPDNLNGTGIDLCCGWGFIARHILEHNPAVETLHLVEADRLALNCAIENMKQWQDRVQNHWLDAAAGALPLKLDWVVCNPPFHTGHATDIGLGQKIIEGACASLKRNGCLWMVANRKLPYEATLDKRLMRHRIVIQDQGFKVIEAIKGGAQRIERQRKTQDDEPDGWTMYVE